VIPRIRVHTPAVTLLGRQLTDRSGGLRTATDRSGWLRPATDLAEDRYGPPRTATDRSGWLRTATDRATDLAEARGVGVYQKEQYSRPLHLQ
jgi:hypothetical protein